MVLIQIHKYMYNSRFIFMWDVFAIKRTEFPSLSGYLYLHPLMRAVLKYTSGGGGGVKDG